MADTEQMTEVVFYTKRHVVRGWLSLVPGARLTDFMREADEFIAVSEALVSDRDGSPLFRTDFLDLRRDCIDIALPAGHMKPIS